MANNSVSIKTSITGLSPSVRINRTVESDNLDRKKRDALPAAKIGTCTRSDANTGVLTMASGHGITTGNLLHLYWTEGGVKKFRRSVVGTVSGNSVPIDLGAGDDLPVTAATAITAMVPFIELLPLDGDSIQALLLSCSRPAQVAFLDGSNVELVGITTDGSNAYFWDADSGKANPLNGVIVESVRLSHGYSSGTADVLLETYYD